MSNWSDPAVAPQLQARVAELQERGGRGLDPAAVRAELEHLAQTDDRLISDEEFQLIETALDHLAGSPVRPSSAFEPAAPRESAVLEGPVMAFVSDRQTTQRVRQRLERSVSTGEREDWQAARDTALGSLNRLKQAAGKALHGLPPELRRVFACLEKRLEAPAWQTAPDAAAVARLDAAIDEALAALAPADRLWLENAAVRVRHLADSLATHVDKVGCETVSRPSSIDFRQQALSIVCTPVAHGISRRAEAERRARTLAERDPDHAYAVREYRQPSPVGGGESPLIEYRIEKLPAASYDQLAAESRTGGKLVSAAVQRDGRVITERLSGPVSRIYTGGNLFDANVPLDPTLADNKIFRSEAMERVGGEARDVMVQRYDEAITGFDLMTRDPVAMARGILHVVATAPDSATAAKRLADSFGVSNRNPHPPADADPDVIAYWTDKETAAEELVSAARHLLAVADQPGVRESLLAAFATTPGVRRAQERAKDRLESLREARTEVAGMDRTIAAYKLLREYPAIRTEVYRRCGFERLASRTRSFPPMKVDEVKYAASIGNFTSNGEMLFARAVDIFDDHAAVGRVLKSVGIIAVGAFIAALGPGGTGFWAAVGASAASGTADIVEGVGRVADAQRDYAAGLRSDQDVKRAESYRDRAAVGAMADLATAGLTRMGREVSAAGEAIEGAVRAAFDPDNQGNPLTMLFGALAGAAGGGLARSHGGAVVGGTATVTQRAARVPHEAPAEGPEPVPPRR